MIDVAYSRSTIEATSVTSLAVVMIFDCCYHWIFKPCEVAHVTQTIEYESSGVLSFFCSCDMCLGMVDAFSLLSPSWNLSDFLGQCNASHSVDSRHCLPSLILTDAMGSPEQRLSILSITSTSCSQSVRRICIITPTWLRTFFWVTASRAGSTCRRVRRGVSWGWSWVEPRR